MLQIKPCWELILDRVTIVLFNLVNGRVIRISDKKSFQEIVFLFNQLEKGTNKKKLIKDFLKEFPNENKVFVKNFLKKMNELHLIENFNRRINEDYFTKFDRQYYYLSSLEDSKIDRYKMQENIKKTKIAILGIGSTGQWLIPALIESGFKNFIIVDFDDVEEKNLLAQVLFSRKDIGRQKIDSVHEKMLDMEPSLNVTKINKRLLTEADVKNIVKNSDIVAHCCDIPRFKIHRVITKACIDLKIPNIVIQSAKVGPFNIPGKTPCYFCLESKIRASFPEYDLLVEKLANTPSRRFPGLPLVCSIMGVLGAKEILLHISNKIEPSTYKNILIWNPTSGEIIQNKIETKKRCNFCGFKGVN